jgi:hypothetical protein
MADTSEIQSDLERAATLSDYEAVNVLWVALIKAANMCSGRDEFIRMRNLSTEFAEKVIGVILYSEPVDRLLNLDPPLETVLVNPREILATERTAKAISEIRNKRGTAPREALLDLGMILKTIRNKREHGFKSHKGARDAEILNATRLILAELCRCAITSLS